METFRIGNASYRIEYSNPKPKAKYGLAYTFWYSNMTDLLFSLEFIDKTWINKEYIDIAICSYADIPANYLERIKPIVSYIVKAEQDFGKLDGTTAHANGAIYPLIHTPTIEAVTHSDTDVSFLNQSYFFGLSTMLLDSGKVLLTSQESWLYNIETMKSSILPDDHYHFAGGPKRHFGSTYILNSKRALDSGYFPCPLRGSFEMDRCNYFTECGLSVEQDAIIVRRAPFDNNVPPGFLYSFDFHLGLVHCTNRLEYPELEDRKLRMLKLMGFEKWDNIPLGWKWDYNPKSPRPGYKCVTPPAQPEEFH